MRFVNDRHPRHHLIAALALLVAGVSSALAVEPEATDAAAADGDDTPLETVTVVGDAEDADEDEDAWFDNSHGYMTDRANALTRWVDNYFGEPEADLEQAHSRLRLRFIHDADEFRGTDFRLRVSGKVNLPRISRRLDLVFRDDNAENPIAEPDERGQDRVGLQLQVGNREDDANRFDFTVGMSSSGPRPGVRYRYYGQLSEHNRMRFVQRLQYELDDGAIAQSQLFLDHDLGNDQILRSGSRIRYGESTNGVEWSTSVAHIARWPTNNGWERASVAYVGMGGRTEPFDYTDNYQIGVRLRRQAIREYLFFELEPSYNWRIDEPGMDRRGAWNLSFRVEVLLDAELRRDGVYANR